MSSFDFSIYDYEDTTSAPTIKKTSTPKKQEKFDFSIYDQEEPVNEVQPTSEPVDYTKFSNTAGGQVINSLVRGGGSAIANIFDRSAKAQKEASLPALLGYPPDTRTEEAISKTIRSNLPEESTGIVPRLIEGGAEMGLDPASWFGGPAGAVGAFTGGVSRKGAEMLGLPPWAQFGASLVGGIAGGKAAGGPIPSIEKQTKPSGLPTRRYESTKKEIKISPSRKASINEKVESDFKTISDKIIDKSKIGATSKSLKENASFKEEVGNLFQEVENLSEKITGVFPSDNIKRSILNSSKSKLEKGLSPSEYEKGFESYMRGYAKDLKSKNVNASDLVNQYRKNNKSLSEYFEPGSAKSINNAKRDALIEYNKIIADQIEKYFPGTEFSKLFKETNKYWSEIKGVEFVDNFIDGIFSGKIDFQKGSKFFNKGTRDEFKRVLGKEEFGNFEQLMKDLMSTQRANALLKTAESKGFKDLGSNVFAYLIHPKLAAAKIGKDGVEAIYRSLLDKPKLAIKWENGVRAMKREDFKEAEKIFNSLDAETKRVSALKVFNRKVKDPSISRQK